MEALAPGASIEVPGVAPAACIEFTEAQSWKRSIRRFLSAKLPVRSSPHHQDSNCTPIEKPEVSSTLVLPPINPLNSSDHVA